jgi:ABC-type glycerol-3-phosphate transport system substrate-binding protein
VLQLDADEFAKANAGASVDVLSIPVGEIVQKIQAAVAGKAGPDVVYADLVQVPTCWKAGLLTPLDDRIRSDKIDLKDFFDGFLQYAYQDGKYFSIPHEANLQFLTWNKTLFEQNGLDPERGPKTWEEVVDFARKTTGADQKTFGYALPAVNSKDGIGRMAYNMASLLWKLDGQFLKPDGKGREERGWPAFNNELGEQAWSFWVDLVNKHKVATLSPPASAFQAGLVGMQEFNPPALPGVKAAIGGKFKIGVGLFPPKKKLANFAGGAHLAILRDSANLDLSWKFTSFMLSPDIQLRWFTTTGFVPQRKTLTEHPAYQKWLGENPEYKLTGEILPFVKPRPPIPLCNELLNKAALEMEPVLFGQLEVRKSLDNAANAIVQVFKDSNYNPDTAP